MKMLLVTVLTSVTNQELGVAWIRPENWDSLVSPPSLVTLHNIISMNQGSNVTKISHFLLEQQQKLMLVLGSLFMKFLFPIKVMTHVLAPGTNAHGCERVRSECDLFSGRQLRRYLQQCASVTVPGSLTMWCRLLTSRSQQFIASSEPGHRDFHY